MSERGEGGVVCGGGGRVGASGAGFLVERRQAEQGNVEARGAWQ